MIPDLWVPHKASMSFRTVYKDHNENINPNRSNMLHTAFVVVRFIVLFPLFFIAQRYISAAVDRWCDFCEGLWRFEEELKESHDNP